MHQIYGEELRKSTYWPVFVRSEERQGAYARAWKISIEYRFYRCSYSETMKYAYRKAVMPNDYAGEGRYGVTRHRKKRQLD